jgi:hypothetical protein
MWIGEEWYEKQKGRRRKKQKQSIRWKGKEEIKNPKICEEGQSGVKRVRRHGRCKGKGVCRIKWKKYNTH